MKAQSVGRTQVRPTPRPVRRRPSVPDASCHGPGFASGYLLAEERKHRRMMQAQPAEGHGRLGSAVSQIDYGAMSTLDSIVHYVEALRWPARRRRQLRRPHTDRHHYRCSVTLRRSPSGGLLPEHPNCLGAYRPRRVLLCEILNTTADGLRHVRRGAANSPQQE